MPLERFLDAPDGPNRSLTVVNRTQPEPFQRMIEKLFDGQDVRTAEGSSQQFAENTVLLLEGEDVVAKSQLEELQDSILMVNSDLYSTGTRDLENTNVPAVIEELTDIRFSLQGYPESNSEKLLLILISRYIERLAFEHGDGTLRSSFQRLSRIADEQGTRRVYERVADTDVDVHVYGQPDWTPTPEFPVTMHGGYTADFRDSWFVIHTPPDESATRAGALLAIEDEPRSWEGFWTYDDALVEDMAAYVRRHL